MNRTAKAVIGVLIICVGLLTYLLIRRSNEERKRVEFLREHCRFLLISSEQINALADQLEDEKNDTTGLYLSSTYERIRNDMYRWNNQTAFTLAHDVAISIEDSDTLSDIGWDYLDISTKINGLLLARGNASEFEAGELDSLISYMHQLADVTDRFDHTAFHE